MSSYCTFGLTWEGWWTINFASEVGVAASATELSSGCRAIHCDALVDEVYGTGAGVGGHDQTIGEGGVFQTSSCSDGQSMYSWINSSEENSCIRTWRYGY